MSLLVDVGIASNKNQPPDWWTGAWGEILRVEQKRGGIRIGRVLASQSALGDFRRNKAAEMFLRPANTAENRNAVMEGYLEGQADAIWWLDDDTIPPEGALEALVALNADIAAGIYFKRGEPYEPIVYRRNEEKLYNSILDYRVGEILRDVDSVGMGCTLVRRHVYAGIEKQYRLFRRAATNTLIALHQDDIETPERAGPIAEHVNKLRITNDGLFYVQEIWPLEQPVAQWPFYAMEYGRTEDHHFCEMALRCGFEIAVDTAVECGHLGKKVYGGDDFRKMRRDYVRSRREGSG